MDEHPATGTRAVCWRQLSQYLWIGSDEDGPIGIVEHGWRFKAIDVEGALIARCHELEEAQRLIEHVTGARDSTGDRGAGRRGS